VLKHSDLGRRLSLEIWQPIFEQAAKLPHRIPTRAGLWRFFTEPVEARWCMTVQEVGNGDKSCKVIAFFRPDFEQYGSDGRG
jgi:hypothetical protein